METGFLELRQKSNGVCEVARGNNLVFSLALVPSFILALALIFMSFNNFETYEIPVLDRGVKLPLFDINKKHLDEMFLDEGVSSDTFLFSLILKGLETKVGRNHLKYKEYYERAKYEMGVFRELGFCDYVLIIWDIVKYCRDNQIPTGISRGSGGGSLVFYLIDITRIDSLKYNLYFERFLSKSRAKFEEIDGVKYYDGSLLLDYDLDISYVDRERVVLYLEGKYPGRVCKVLTIGTLSTKILLKEACKTIKEYNESEANAVSDMVPKVAGFVSSLDECVENSSEFATFAEENEEIIRVCRRLESLNNHVGTHASAWCVAADSLGEIFPLQKDKEGNLVSAYDMNDALNLAIKCDLLGLRTATLVNRVAQLVGIRLEDINVEDPFIYQNLQDIKCPHGLFQIESDTNFKVCKHIKPKSLNDISAVLALARPGALAFVDQYAKFANFGEAQSIHPFFDDVLIRTGQIPIYQEDLIRMVNKLGFSKEEGETVRRIVGKKKREDVEKWRDKIRKKVDDQKLDPKITDILFKVLEDSAKYSFCAGHSFAYAIMCAYTIYLKFKYPKEFFLVLLELAKDEQDSTGQIRKIQGELRHFGINLLGPDLVKSSMDFQIEDNNIRYGLKYVKGISEANRIKILSFKRAFRNKFDIFLAANECGINHSVLASLIQAGAIDSYLGSSSRSKVVLEAQIWSKLTDREKEKCVEHGESYSFDLVKLLIAFNEKINDEKGKPIIKSSRRETIRKKIEPYKEIYRQNSKNERVASYFYESKLLGYSYSQDVVEIYREKAKDLIHIADLADLKTDTNVKICGQIVEVFTSVSKKGTKYCRLKIKDSSGEAIVMLFNKKLEENADLNGGDFAEDQIVIARGRKKEDSIFADVVAIQDVKIYTKLGDLKEKDDAKTDKES